MLPQALDFLTAGLPEVYAYHNALHTQDVCESLFEIAPTLALPESEIDALITAGVFHDFGYLDSYLDNEALALPYMKKFCQKAGIAETVVHRANELILETSYPYFPVSETGKLLCDADIEYIGRSFEYFISRADHLRHELANVENLRFSDHQWIAAEVDFLQKNSFFSPVFRELRDAGRLSNLSLLKLKLQNPEC